MERQELAARLEVGEAGVVIGLKKIGGDAYVIPFAKGWKRLAAIRFALELTGARKAELELFEIKEAE